MGAAFEKSTAARNQEPTTEVFLLLMLLLMLRWRKRPMTTAPVTTTDHDQIRRRVESRDGTPAAVGATGSRDEPGTLRIRFRDESADDLDAIGRGD